MTKLIATILTKNEARHIGDCIKSVQWVDAITVEDSFSDDGTIEIAESLGAKVYQHEFINFANARNIALKNAKSLGGDWIFFIDADERVTPELAEEIQRVIRQDDTVGWPGQTQNAVQSDRRDADIRRVAVPVRLHHGFCSP